MHCVQGAIRTQRKAKQCLISLEIQAGISWIKWGGKGGYYCKKKQQHDALKKLHKSQTCWRIIWKIKKGKKQG